MTMAKEKQIDWPPPLERDGRDEEIGQATGRLRAEYLKTRLGGSGVSQRRWVLKAQALDLLRTTGAPSSLVMLFDMMLGGVSSETSTVRESWIDLIVDIEAHVNQFEARTPTNSELATAIMKAENVSKDVAMRKVRLAHEADWYKGAVIARRYYIIDNPDCSEPT